MTPTAWAHFPNAPHIDRILADLRARPETWDAARNAAWHAAWHAARDATWDTAWDTAWHAARNAARDAAWDAEAALIAWDDVAYMLDMRPDAVLMLIETCTDHHKHAAVLILPACIALNGGEPT